MASSIVSFLPHADFRLRRLASSLECSIAYPRLVLSCPLPFRYFKLKHSTKGGFLSQASGPEITSMEARVQKGLQRNQERSEVKDAQDEDSTDDDEDDGPLMDDEERKELRRKIRQIMDANPHVEEVRDPEERKKRMDALLSEYPLIVDEEDPNWPEDADGWGFNLSQFFDKITIKNVRKEDEDYDSDKEMVWQDDNYIRAVKDIGSKEWEETVFKDISPLIILVHNRYKRPRENERARIELEKAVQIFWNSRLPAPRCVAIDAVVEDDLVSALKVSTFPELLFTKAGKIFYRQRVISNAEDLAKIMAFFYCGATRPACLSKADGDVEEPIPDLPQKS